MEKLPVIFRIDRAKHGAEVTAIFPTLPADVFGRAITCYVHVGQHSAASWDWYHTGSHRPATPKEYASLLRELQGIYGRTYGDGDPVFELVPCKRLTAAHRAVFNAEVARMRTARKL